MENVLEHAPERNFFREDRHSGGKGKPNERLFKVRFSVLAKHMSKFLFS
jgi:hypothetical protein